MSKKKTLDQKDSMTVTDFNESPRKENSGLHNHLKNDGSDLFHTLKLKTKRMDPKHDSMDIDLGSEAASYSPDSGTSPARDQMSSPRNYTHIGSSEALDRVSPDSPGHFESKSNFVCKSEPDRIFDGGGDVSSTPSKAGGSSYVSDHAEDMSMSPPPNHERRNHAHPISPYHQDHRDNRSRHGSPTIHDSLGRDVFDRSHMLSNGNGGRPESLMFLDQMQDKRTDFMRLPHHSILSESLKGGSNSRKARQSSLMIMRDEELQREMEWRETQKLIRGKVALHGLMSSSDASESLGAAKNLLLLGQSMTNGISPRLSPSSTICVSSPGCSPVNTSRSTHALARSPYAVDSPPQNGHCHMVRVSSSGERHRLSTPSSTSSPSPPSHYQMKNRLSRQIPLNMEQLWSGDRTPQPEPDSQAALNLSKCPNWSEGKGNVDSSGMPITIEDEEEEAPMTCMVCEDKATGLHYGIFTCEGCKGFFKRTVQNKRVYTCVADGKCEITKTQRNRCQYCRFHKCLDQGMVIAAVREDRMPGGRNSGAVYNLYKVKYKKKKNKNGQIRVANLSPEKSKASSYDSMAINGTSLSPHPLGPNPPTPLGMSLGLPMGNSYPEPITSSILKTALTNPAEVAHYRHRHENIVTTSTADQTPHYATVRHKIQELIDCDDFESLATLDNLQSDDCNTDLSHRFSEFGDIIGMRLVNWTKRLPFFNDLPVVLHKQLLTTKWQELLVLTTTAYQAIYGGTSFDMSANIEEEFNMEVERNWRVVESSITNMTGDSTSVGRNELLAMVHKLTKCIVALRRRKLQVEEYVCLKVIVLLNQAIDKSTILRKIYERYVSYLRSFCESHFPSQPNRVSDLLYELAEVTKTGETLIESKLFYVPFMICKDGRR